jgi:hypothetical protein
MTELSDIVAAQNRTTLLLRAFLKIFLIYFSASLVIGLSVVGYLYFTVRNLTGCALSSLTVNCSTNNLPLFFEIVIAIVGVASIILTLVIASTALTESDSDFPTE